MKYPSIITVSIVVFLVAATGSCVGTVENARTPPRPSGSGSAPAPNEAEVRLFRAPPINNVIDGVVFESGNWEPHLAPGAEGSSWGNHRAVVVSNHSGVDAVLVTIPWRRRDANPEEKSIVVVDVASGESVANALALRVENASGDVVFQPNDGSDTYHVYYMPWKSTGGYYPSITYPRLETIADPTWEASVRAADHSEFTTATTTHIQSINDFHSFFPMEVIATAEETADFMAGVRRGWALVPEHRDYPVRMRRFIPHHWSERGQRDRFSSTALRGEYFTFQLAAVAGVEELADLRVSFQGFPPSIRRRLTCFNCEGVNERGEKFAIPLAVETGTIQPIWIGLDIPETWPRNSVIAGTILVSSSNRGAKAIDISIRVGDHVATNRGFDTPELQTRLAWLNSTAGADPNFIIDPFLPVEIDGRSLSILGRRVDLGAIGLPDQLVSFFSPEMTHLTDDALPVLTEPIVLNIDVAGNMESFRSSDYAVSQPSTGRVEWGTRSQSANFELQVEGALEYDGMLDYRITVRATNDVDVEDIALPVHLQPEAAKYMLGLGRRGGQTPDSLDWKWLVENHQEGVWLGGINRGLQYVLRDDGYVRPLNTNFYQNQPLRMPTSWFNDGRGGIFIEASEQAVTANNYSGPRSMAAGDSLQFNIRFLLTPFKPIDTETHFQTRFVHKYVPVDSVIEWGGTVVNIHHANEINPYINYPFFNLDLQTAYIEEAHSKGVKVKLYDTIRELTYRAHELFPMRSLGNEIFNDGEGGGHSWMQEHLEADYHSAWHAWRVDDAAMLNKGTSRWTNYYVEGLSWLAANQHIDGLYLDDIAFSRETVKRIISVLHAERDEVVIDLHSANQFNPRDGHINSAMLYMEHFPFISRLWFGEYFEYDRDEDYWFTEVSGLPFGLMGEMLQDGGHPYRGLLYGMTTRMYGDVDPRPVWAMMNDFGIDQSRMLGYWLDNPPITTNHPQIRATTYIGEDQVLVVLASWSDEDQIVDLTVDQNGAAAPSGTTAWVPAVEGLQEEAEVELSAVPVQANQGLYLIIK